MMAPDWRDALHTGAAMATTIGLLLVSSGCSTMSSKARTRAASDLSCPDTGVVVEEVAHNAYRATGCNQTVAYQCAGYGSLGNCEVTEGPAPIKTAAKSSEPTDQCAGKEPSAYKCAAIFTNGNETRDCLLGCQMQEQTCIANTPPMTSERAACVNNVRPCVIGCNEMYRAGKRVEVPTGPGCTCQEGWDRVGDGKVGRPWLDSGM